MAGSTTSRSAVTPENICSPPGDRTAVPGFSSSRAAGQAKVFIYHQFTWPANCPYQDPYENGQTSGTCSGNTLSNGLVLMAAHCVDYYYARKGLLAELRDPKNPNPYPPKADPCNIANIPVVVKGILVCYNYNNTDGGPKWVKGCAAANPQLTINANGVSWHPQDGNFLNDQAIIFLAAPKTLYGYYQYNYQDNYPAGTAAEGIESWSYIGDDCTTCGTECKLSHTGPASLSGSTFGGPSSDPVQLPITSLPGISGSCATYKDGCCFAIASFITFPGGSDLCSTKCTNFWSPIVAQKPLSDLWRARQVVLAPLPPGTGK